MFIFLYRTLGPLYNPNYQIYLIVICENILKITIIWQNELFNGKGLKISVGLFHSTGNAMAKRKRTK
jgi:hypothetical protein